MKNNDKIDREKREDLKGTEVDISEVTSVEAGDEKQKTGVVTKVCIEAGRSV